MPPEVDPGYLTIPGVTLAAHSSLRVLAARVGISPDGYTQASYHLVVTLGADFGTRLDRSIRLLGPDNVRYLADEAAVSPALLTESGYQLDGWVTFLLPAGMAGPATLQVTIDPRNLTEILVPVVIADGASQPTAAFSPVVVLDQPSAPPAAPTAPRPSDSPGGDPSQSASPAVSGTVLP